MLIMLGHVYVVYNEILSYWNFVHIDISKILVNEMYLGESDIKYR